MGYSPAESHVHADEIGDAFTDDMVERMSERLGHPDRCPHGWPIDTQTEQLENRELLALSDVEPGVTVDVVRLAEHDGELLNWFYDEGYIPGKRVEVLDYRRAAHQIKVRLEGTERAISDSAAEGLFVRPAA
jgi:DtxR family Mn-dependent transcriptional regulator